MAVRPWCGGAESRLAGCDCRSRTARCSRPRRSRAALDRPRLPPAEDARSRRRWPAVGHRGGLHPGPHRRPGPLPRLARAARLCRPTSCWWWTTPRSSDATRSLVERRGGRGALRARAEARARLGPQPRRSPRPRATSWPSPTTTCSVDPGWVRALAAAFGARPEAVAAVTGLVLPAELETEAQVLFERYRSFARGFAPGGSQADPAPGPIGWPLRAAGRLRHRRQHGVPARRVRPGRSVRPGARRRHAGPGGDDLEMFFRVLKEGHALVYEPSADRAPPASATLIELRRRSRTHGIGFSAYMVRSGLAPSRGAAGVRCGLACWWCGQDCCIACLAERRAPRARSAGSAWRSSGLRRRTRPLPGRAAAAARSPRLPCIERARMSDAGAADPAGLGGDALPQRRGGDRRLHREDPADLRPGGDRRRDRRVRQRLDRPSVAIAERHGRAGGAPARAGIRQRVPQGLRERAGALPRDGRRRRHLRLHHDPRVPRGRCGRRATTS